MRLSLTLFRMYHLCGTKCLSLVNVHLSDVWRISGNDCTKSQSTTTSNSSSSTSTAATAAAATTTATTTTTSITQSPRWTRWYNSNRKSSRRKNCLITEGPRGTRGARFFTEAIKHLPLQLLLVQLVAALQTLV
jgi:hypothetical protein